MLKFILKFLVLASIPVTIAGVLYLKQNFESGRLQEKIIEKAIEDIAPINSTSTSHVQRALGMQGERYYLALFLNNTEIRPGGGFIGSYAVVKMVNGKPEILKVEGTEILDNFAPNAFETPPPPLAKYLGIKKWQFRDSNWSPDFPTSAQTSLEFYKKQKGLHADKISGVIGVTPTLFEQILKIIGPVTVDGIEFKSENFTEKLEYEVEYGFEDRGIHFDDRKQLLTKLSHAMMPRLVMASITHFSDFMKLVPRMLKEKQIMLYSTDIEEQKFITQSGWAGDMKSYRNDYLLWVDSNLGALKTDVAISRGLSYTLTSSSSGAVAVATMKYKHNGKFDWRTTRYRNYVRIFVPSGSEFIKAEGNKEAVEQGEENGYQWFGTFISIEPGKEGQMSFTYKLPDYVSLKIKNGSYDLLVQKQLGTISPKLTLNLKFDKNLSSAKPAEQQKEWGNSSYRNSTDLKEDRSFHLTF